MSEEGSSGFGIFLNFFSILVQRKRLIFWLTVVPTLICAVVVLVSRSSYESQALINPPSGGGSGLESMLKGVGDGATGGLLSSFLGGGSETGLDDCESILASVRFGRLVIARFDLDSVYKYKKPGKHKKYFFADVYKTFRRNARYEVTDEDAIKITVKDHEPERARAMVAYMIQTLDSLYIDIQRTEIKHRLEYVDHRMEMAEADMKSVEDSLVAFQNRNNLLVPQAQISLILENTAQTEINLENLKEQMALEANLRGTSSSRYRDMGVQRNLMEQTLQRQLRSKPGPNSLILPATHLPTLATEYFRLERAYTIRLGVYKYLVQQVEALKLNAEQNVQVISVIDPPWVNEKRVSPKRRVMVEAVFIIAFLFSVTLAVLLALWDKHKREHPGSAGQFAEIRRGIFKW